VAGDADDSADGDDRPGLADDRPGLADDRRGERGATPLMIAIARDDLALARLVLAARPDLGPRDLAWQSDALGWAEHLGRTRLGRTHPRGGGPRGPSRDAL